MKEASFLSANKTEAAVRTYGNMLYRLCLVMLGSESDAEDAVQETFIRYFQKAPSFADAEHEKAWLLKVAANQCRDRLRARKRVTPVAEVAAQAEVLSDGAVLEALMTLPEKFRLVLILHYVEGYGVEEIAGIIGKTPSAVKMRLQKGRRLLAEAYGKEQ